jgi:hypothetical protein
MNLPRKTLFVVPLAGAVLGTPALLVRAPVAPGGGGHAPLLQVASLPARVRRRVRGAKRRVIPWWNGLRVRDTARRIRASSESVKSRLAPHDSYARGPPRSSGG